MQVKNVSSVPFMGIATLVAAEQAQAQADMEQRYSLGLVAAVATPRGHTAFYAAPAAIRKASRRFLWLTTTR